MTSNRKMRCVSNGKLIVAVFQCNLIVDMYTVVYR